MPREYRMWEMAYTCAGDFDRDERKVAKMAATEKRFPRLLAGVNEKTGDAVISLCDGEYSGEVVIGVTDEAAANALADLLAEHVVYVQYANVKVFNREIGG